MKKKIVFSLILLFLIGGRGFAEEKTVISIKVEGNETVSSQRILSLLRTRVGETFSKRILNEDVKRLYKTAYFSDITVETKEEKGGIVLTIKLKENLIIGNISVRGNKIFKKSQIKKEIPFKVGDFFNEKKLKDAVSAISKLYEKKQIFFTEIKPEVKTEDKKITIIFHLKEGKRGRVTQIRFEGNKTFSDEKLKRKMKIKERGFLRLGTFKKKALEEDKAKIINFYKGNGFANVQLKEVKVIPDKKKRKLSIVIVIDEGKRFYLGERKLAGNLLFPEEELKKRFFLKTGSFYRENAVNAESNSLRNYYTDRGYLLTKIEIIQRPKPDTTIIDLTYRIEPGKIISIEEVKIRGNNITKDNVIRREIKIKPGEVFSGKKLRKSIVNLSDLGYFEDIGVNTEPGTTADTRNLVLTVDEKEKTGLFSFGGGYSSIDKIIGFVGIEQRNFDWRDWPHFVGGGQNIKLSAEFGATKKNFSLSFTNPWIFDKPISFGFDIYSITREWNEYTEGRLGGDIRLNRRFRDGLYVLSGMLKSEEIDISDIEAGVSPDLKKEEGKNLVNSITLGLTRDSRNSRIRPTSGSKNGITVEYAGLGGDKNFTKEILESTFYFSLPKGFVLSQKMQFGIAQQDVPIYERFYAGGANSIRGYEERSVGPRDNLDNPIGGKAIFIENLELTHSLYQDILYWAIFFDAGNVWSRPKNIGLADLRKGVGAGIRIKVPLFQLPVRIDYGYPLDPEPGEKQKGIVHFTMQWGF